MELGLVIFGEKDNYMEKKYGIGLVIFGLWKDNDIERIIWKLDW